MSGYDESVSDASAGEAISALSNALKPFAEDFQKAYDAFRALVDDPEVRETARVLSAITAGMQHFDAKAWEALLSEWDSVTNPHRKAELLGEYGWTLPMSMSPFQLHEILELNDPALIEAEFVKYYSQDNGSTYARLSRKLLSSPDLALWRDLLDQCCRAYERGEYLIAVPSLLTVLEGAIAVPENAKFVGGEDRKRYFEEKIAAAPSDSVTQYMWRSVGTFVKMLFQKKTFGTPPPAQLNRHWILHGRDTPDWGRADCLRLFQAIETIISLRR